MIKIIGGKILKIDITKLQKEISWLEEIEGRVKGRLSHAPKGRLRIMEKQDGTQYYYIDIESINKAECSKNGRYLRKSERGLAKQLAQRDYDMQIIKAAEARKKAIERFVEVYEQTDLGKIYQKTNQYRKELITPGEISDEEYVKCWLAEEYPRMGFEENAPEFITERGERVRSKSEKIIADKLYILGIPYRYEYPLKLEGNITRRPDFMILKMPERKEVYLEHLGMLDKQEYLEDAIYKWNLYEKNGLYIGDKLFFTHETSKYPLNTRVLDGLLRKIFMNE